MSADVKPTVRIKSTSAKSAECSDIVVRETSTTRLVFRPLIVDNPHDTSASVKGTFLYQRKGRSEAWEDHDTVSLSTLKKGEGYRLALKSGELRPLVNELLALYRLHDQLGVPRGDIEFVRLADGLEGVASLEAEDLAGFLKAHESIGADLLGRLLTWAAGADDLSALLEYLGRLGSDSLTRLHSATRISVLTSVLADWEASMGNEAEQFWQSALTQNSFVLEQVYAWPVTVVKERAYVGGKTVVDSGGGVADFLVRNGLTKNAGLIEIKTPQTPLLGKKYRSGVWGPSDQLAGAVVQVLSYRDRLLKE